jgi:hypothetical protein
LKGRIGELLEDLRWGLRRIWWRMTGGTEDDPRRIYRRRRRVAVLVVVVSLVAVFWLVPVPGIPCGASPAKTCVPADDAIGLVPAGADAYLHVDLDRDTHQFQLAEDVAGRLPHFGEIVQGAFGALGSSRGVNLRADVAPWIGGEAAFAQLPGRPPRSLALLAIGNEAGAAQFEAKLEPGRGRPTKAPGGEMRVYRDDFASSQTQGFLVLGSRTAVRAAVAAGAGRLDDLSDSKLAGSVRDSLPEQRVADAYLSPAGAERLLARRGALGAQLDTFADFNASRAIAAAVVADDDGFGLQLDSQLAPAKTEASPSFFAAFPTFEPSLAGEFPADTLIYLGIANPAQTVQALLGQARAAAPGVVAAYARLRRQLRRGDVELEQKVLSLLGGEAALGVAQARGIPYLTAVFDDVDEDRARAEMAALQAPLIAAFGPDRTGQAPSFDSSKLGDTVMHSVRLSPTLDLAYAIFDAKLVVATNPAGVRAAVEGDDDLSSSEGYRASTSGASSGVSALVFLNLEGLVKRAEALGLPQIVRGFGEDVAKLKAIGLTVKGEDDRLETKFFLNIK